MRSSRRPRRPRRARTTDAERRPADALPEEQRRRGRGSATRAGRDARRSDARHRDATPDLRPRTGARTSAATTGHRWDFVTDTVTTTRTASPTATPPPDPASAPDPWVHLAWRALGTDVRVTVLATSAADAEGIVDLAPPILERIEARWSRFRPESELRRLNRAAGNPVVVSPDTFAAIAHAVEAWRASRGRFDPTVLPSLIALGYDRDFRSVAPDGPGITGTGPAVGCDGIILDPLVHAVTLPVGTALDLGGIGKGLAADRLAAELLAAGATGVCADLGGDVRVSGRGPQAGAWSVNIDDPLQTGATGALLIREGAAATSTRLRRSWRRGGRTVHHLVDPQTGEPADTGLASVTVVAGTTWWAEVLAKTAFIAGPEDGAALIGEAGVTGLFVHDDGHVTELAGLHSFRPEFAGCGFDRHCDRSARDAAPVVVHGPGQRIGRVGARDGVGVVGSAPLGARDPEAEPRLGSRPPSLPRRHRVPVRAPPRRRALRRHVRRLDRRRRARALRHHVEARERRPGDRRHVPAVRDRAHFVRDAAVAAPCLARRAPAVVHRLHRGDRARTARGNRRLGAGNPVVRDRHVDDGRDPLCGADRIARHPRR